MIEHKVGDMFTVSEGYIVHGCNGQGVMGAGVAGQIKFYFPNAFEVYKQSGHALGENSYYMQGNLCIVNAVTQDFYGNDGKRYTDYDAVRQCFRELNSSVMEGHLPKVVNFPLIGCGLGGGEWGVIKCIIDNELDDSIEKVLWTLE